MGGPHELPQGWRKLFAMFKNLPKLEAIALRYDKHCCAEPLIFGDVIQSEEYRSTVMKWLLSEVVALPRPLKELAIQNNQNTTHLGENGDAVLGGLSSLRLNVVHEFDIGVSDEEVEVGSTL